MPWFDDLPTSRPKSDAMSVKRRLGFLQGLVEGSCSLYVAPQGIATASENGCITPVYRSEKTLSNGSPVFVSFTYKGPSVLNDRNVSITYYFLSRTLRPFFKRSERQAGHVPFAVSALAALLAVPTISITREMRLAAGAAQYLEQVAGTRRAEDGPRSKIFGARMMGMIDQGVAGEDADGAYVFPDQDEEFCRTDKSDVVEVLTEMGVSPQKICGGVEFSMNTTQNTGLDNAALSPEHFDIGNSIPASSPCPHEVADDGISASTSDCGPDEPYHTPRTMATLQRGASDGPSDAVSYTGIDSAFIQKLLSALTTNNGPSYDASRSSDSRKMVAEDGVFFGPRKELGPLSALESRTSTKGHIPSIPSLSDETTTHSLMKALDDRLAHHALQSEKALKRISRANERVPVFESDRLRSHIVRRGEHLDLPADLFNELLISMMRDLTIPETFLKVADLHEVGSIFVNGLEDIRISSRGNRTVGSIILDIRSDDKNLTLDEEMWRRFPRFSSDPDDWKKERDQLCQWMTEYSDERGITSREQLYSVTLQAIRRMPRKKSIWTDSILKSDENKSIPMSTRFEEGFCNAVTLLKENQQDWTDGDRSGSFRVLEYTVRIFIDTMFEQTQGRYIDLLKQVHELIQDRLKISGQVRNYRVGQEEGQLLEDSVVKRWPIIFAAYAEIYPRVCKTHETYANRFALSVFWAMVCVVKWAGKQKQKVVADGGYVPDRDKNQFYLPTPTTSRDKTSKDRAPGRSHQNTRIVQGSYSDDNFESDDGRYNTSSASNITTTRIPGVSDDKVFNSREYKNIETHYVQYRGQQNGALMPCVVEKSLGKVVLGPSENPDDAKPQCVLAVFSLCPAGTRCFRSHLVADPAFWKWLHQQLMASNPSIFTKEVLGALTTTMCESLSSSKRAFHSAFAGATTATCFEVGKQFVVRAPKKFQFSDATHIGVVFPTSPGTPAEKKVAEILGTINLVEKFAEWNLEAAQDFRRPSQ